MRNHRSSFRRRNRHTRYDTTTSNALTTLTSRNYEYTNKRRYSYHIDKKYNDKNKIRPKYGFLTERPTSKIMRRSERPQLRRRLS